MSAAANAITSLRLMTCPPFVMRAPAFGWSWPREFVFRLPLPGLCERNTDQDRDKQSNLNIQMTNKSVSDMEVSFWIFTLVTE
jgi:hypothetical protein